MTKYSPHTLQLFLHLDTSARYKCDTVVADDTECITLVLWEDLIDSISTGKCYHFKNFTIRIFNDIKFLNTNESTIIKEIDEIENVQIDAAEITDNLLMAQIVDVNVKKSTSCLACNKALTTQQENEEEEITCSNCKITTSIFLQHKAGCSNSRQNTQGTLNLYMLQRWHTEFSKKHQVHQIIS